MPGQGENGSGRATPASISAAQIPSPSLHVLSLPASIMARPARWAVALLLALALLLAVLMVALPGLPHAPAFVFLMPIMLAARFGPLSSAAAVTGMAVLVQLALEALHPAAAGLTPSALLRALALLCVGALVCGLGFVLQRTRARWEASLRAHQETAASHQLSEDRLRSLLAREHTAEQRERHRIARELHDDMQQRLAAISLELAALRQQLPRGDGTLEDGLKRATTMAVDAIVATRRIVAGLRPRILDEFGLATALQQLGKDFSTRTGIGCEVSIQEGGEDASPATPVEADCLYRVAQEALQNVEKHAGARTVQMRLDAGQPGVLELEVRDDGIGLADGALNKPASLGLLGMTERTRELGGTLEVRNGEQAGTLVRARIKTQPGPGGGRRAVRARGASPG